MLDTAVMIEAGVTKAVSIMAGVMVAAIVVAGIMATMKVVTADAIKLAANFNQYLTLICR